MLTGMFRCVYIKDFGQIIKGVLHFSCWSSLAIICANMALV